MVNQLSVVPLRPLTPKHWLPEVAADSPQRLLYTVYEPVTTESYWPHSEAVALTTVFVGAAAATAATEAATMDVENFILTINGDTRQGVCRNTVLL